MKNTILLLLSMLFMTACNQTTPTTSALSEQELAKALENDKSSIQEIIKEYENALERKDPTACASMYASNGVMMPDDSEPLSGEEILKWYESWVSSINASGIEDWSVDFKVQEIEVHHDWAYARTENAGTSVKDDQTEDWKTKSVYLFVRQGDGAWKVKAYAFDGIADDEEENQ